VLFLSADTDDFLLMLDFFGHVMRRQGLQALVVGPNWKSRRETGKRTTKTEVFGQSMYMFGG